MLIKKVHMTLSVSNSQPQGFYHHAHKTSHPNAQTPTLTFDTNPVRTVSTLSPKPPAVLGELNVSNLPSREEARPADDHRSAMEVYYDNPILSRGILSASWDRSAQGQARRATLIDDLKGQVGDFSSDNTDPQSRADAMFRLARVVNYIDNDAGVERVGSARIGDGFLDTVGSHRSSSEAGRLMAFGRRGYDALESFSIGRAIDDKRTVEEITAGPLFKGLYAALNDEELDAFKSRVGGDWERASLPPSVRADLAATAERVLQVIDRKGGEESTPDNGKIDGLSIWVPLISEAFLSSVHYTRPGSEAARVGQFANKGFSALHQK
ncbi:hypothetical protein ACI77I_11090 [Pseudomonas sp. D47]|uniref:hypothetical protein n=1 Tax=Pseudomonas sp. D47 TaxID=3159447 RepID=UPI00387B56EC